MYDFGLHEGEKVKAFLTITMNRSSRHTASPNSSALDDPIIRQAQEGDWLFKYAYSDSKCIRRFFWLSRDMKELRWGNTFHDKRYLSVQLSEMIGITFGSDTTTFAKLRALPDHPEPWLCFSLIFVGRTLDLSTPSDNAHQWFEAIQFASRCVGGSCITSLTRSELTRRKMMMKVRSKAHKLGLTLGEHVRRTLERVLGKPKIFTPISRIGHIVRSKPRNSFDPRALIDSMKSELATLRSLVYDMKQTDFVTDACDGILEFISTPSCLHSRDSYASQLIRQDLFAAQAEVRRLHNELMDLKGNIRVFARVRPMLPGEVDEAVSVKDFRLTVYNENDARNRIFEFDSAFSQSATQTQVFGEVSPFITSFIHGYNICLFAYGVTNSGKTYTMEGTDDDPGINHLALKTIFQNLGSDTIVTISVVQIYNEAVYDLLNDRAQLEIKCVGEVFTLSDLTQRALSSSEEACSIMHAAGQLRATNATKLNISSSRSHFVVTLHMRSSSDPTRVISKLNLIDLAGSENVNRSGASGEILKEAQSINRSLSALGDVMHALIQSKTQPRTHVPFRNSKLTMLLRDSLQGSSKVLMMLQVSPKQADVTESLGSLQFGLRVRTVELGKAKRSSLARESFHDDFYSPTRE